MKNYSTSEKLYKHNLIITHPMIVVMIILLWSNTRPLLDIKFQRFKGILLGTKIVTPDTCWYSLFTQVKDTIRIR